MRKRRRNEGWRLNRRMRGQTSKSIVAYEISGTTIGGTTRVSISTNLLSQSQLLLPPTPSRGRRLQSAKQSITKLIPSFYSKLDQSPDNMSQPQYAPAATAGGQQNGPVSRSYAATCRLENRSLIRLRSISITAIDTDYLHHQTFNIHTSMI